MNREYINREALKLRLEAVSTTFNKLYQDRSLRYQAVKAIGGEPRQDTEYQRMSLGLARLRNEMQSIKADMSKQPEPDYESLMRNNFNRYGGGL